MLTINDKLDVFRRLVSCAAPILFTEYNAKTFQILTDNNESSPFLYFLFSMDNNEGNWGTLEEPAFENLRTSNGYRPIVCTNSLGMIWVSEIEELDCKPYRIHTLGPVFASDYSSRSIAESLSRHTLSEDVRRNVIDFIHSIPVVSITRFYEYGLMLHWCLTGEQITISELMYIDSANNSDKEILNLSKQHNGTYVAEQRMLQSVREGNLQYYKKVNNFSFVGYTEQTLTQNHLRFIKNHVIIYTALCCRAAVEGGLDVETAYTLSDQYLKNIESANNLSSLHELSDTMVRDYIERVSRAKTSSGLSPQIRKACEWISLEPELYNIHSLAENLGYKDYYFSKLFKKETGKSVNEYILLQKIETAKRLLISTNLSVAEITDRLGIESQSYFTTKFREATGIPPKTYRDAYQSLSQIKQ